MADQITIPEIGFIRLKTVLLVIPISRSALWERVRTGDFPKPVKLGRVTMWRAEDVRRFVHQLEAEKPLLSSPKSQTMFAETSGEDLSSRLSQPGSIALHRPPDPVRKPRRNASADALPKHGGEV